MKKEGIKIRNILMGFLFFISFSLLALSSFFLFAMYYSVSNEKSLVDGLRVSFVSDVVNNKQYSLSLDENSIGFLCEFDIVIEQFPYFSKYKQVFCSKIKNGEISSERDVKEFFADVYFKEEIYPVIKSNYFDQIREYIYVAVAFTFIFFVLVFILSYNRNKMALISSAIINGIYLVILILSIRYFIEEGINKELPAEYIEGFSSTVSYLKLVLENTIIYSAILSFLLSELAVFSSKILKKIREEKRE